MLLTHFLRIISDTRFYVPTLLRRYGTRFTRGRPGKKNDNCYVKRKNLDVVRKLIGYARYTTP